VEWKVFLEQEEWEVKNKQDYYLAQLAYEVRRLSHVWGGGEPPPMKDFLLEPGGERQEQVTRTVTEERATTPAIPITEQTFEKPAGAVEVGEELVKDPKWAAVNDQAKAIWASRLGRSG
jgi:hypothetical protein